MLIRKGFFDFCYTFLAAMLFFFILIKLFYFVKIKKEGRKVRLVSSTQIKLAAILF